jgi:16S rRNA (guanine527-N7)-methyltransferase
MDDGTDRQREGNPVRGPLGGGPGGPDTGMPAIDGSDPRVIRFFGDRLEAVQAFAALLLDHGTDRGLIGPREAPRLWERHILNSAAVVPFLPSGAVADVGSGAGLPGLVIAAMEPERPITLIEPMERRVAWLEEAVAHLGLTNVSVARGRAEEMSGVVTVQAVTARAVAPIAKLVTWCAPLLAPAGEMIFLKGRSARAEVDSATAVLRKAGLTAEIHEAGTIEGLESTHVVRLRR